METFEGKELILDVQYRNNIDSLQINRKHYSITPSHIVNISMHISKRFKDKDYYIF